MVRGQGKPPFLVSDTPTQNVSDGPLVAVLTRATVKIQHAPSFWKHVPGISKEIAKQDHLVFKIGVGEVPWLHQVTFSIWDDIKAMEKFAFNSFHGEAISEVRKGGWFKEELFARFDVADVDGTWEGVEPLKSARVQLASEQAKV